MRKIAGESRSGLLIALISLQLICVVLFFLDGMQDANEMGRDFLNSWHFAIEGGAALALLGAIAVETRYLLIMFRSNARLERSVSIASGALQEVIAEHFRTWALTPAEQDVATFTIKGCSINDIAQLRGSSPGTVKSQLNAIYRKAGVVGRSGLLAVLIEDLLDDPLIPESSEAA